MPADKRRHFFVSFNQADRDWATWIAWVLEENDYSVFFQDWDFRGSFIEQMHQASQRAERTLVVLSDHYLHSEYARSEAWHRLTIDPVGREDSVVTVKVGPTTDLGLFSHFAYLDLTNTAEADAERRILERAKKAVDPDYRPKPSIRPRFPQKPTYPGPHNTPNPQPIPDTKKGGLVRKFWPLSRQKNSGIILGFLLIVIASLVLLLPGWNHPLRHFLSPSALRMRLDPKGPPPVALPVNAQLKLYGNRKNNENALYIEQKTSDRFAIDTGIDLETFNPTQEERLRLLKQLFTSQSSEFDVVTIDIIWTTELAPHLIDLEPFFKNEIKLHDKKLLENDMVGNRLVAIPWYQNIGLLFYREDLLKNAGLGVPETWEELEKAAQKIQAEQRKQDPEFVGFAWQGAQYEGLTCNALEWIASWGALDANTGEILFNNPGLLDALDRAREWTNGASAISPNANHHMEEESLQLFRNGNAAFLRTWSNEYARLKQSGIPFGVAPLPRGLGDKSFGVVGGWQLAVPKYSLNQSAATEFIRYLSSPEVQKWRAENGTYQPTFMDRDVQDALPFWKDDRISNTQRIFRPSSQLGDRYGDVSKCIYTSVNAVLGGKSRQDTEQKIMNMRNCIVSVQNNDG